jgi:Lrp/AsnC family transcriptional regulator, leucine-responsive regulatory protein
MAAEIDRIDRRILQHLQHDARMSNADLAKAVHVSTATCYRRTQRLFQEGYIHTVRAEIVPARVSRGTLVVVGVVLDRSTPESFATFEAAIRKLPVMLDCYLVAGDFDYFLKSGCATSPTSTSCMGTSSLPCRVSARPAPFSS